MEARNRHLPDWFVRVRTGQVRLPRFQRLEAWTHVEVTNLLESMFDGLPAGAALILDVGDREPFVSRPMVGAPPPSERVTEHLLDGQQRLTALWRSLNDLYEDRTYFVTTTDGEEDIDKSVIRSTGRWTRPGDPRRFPLWADSPAEQFARELIPLRLLRPGEVQQEIGAWLQNASAGDMSIALKLQERILSLRSYVNSFNLPFLSLPVSTEPSVAVDVFVRMNTSSVPLTPFDIVVAQVEAETGRPLRDLGDELHAAVPNLGAFIEPADLILNVAALREDRSPTQASAFRLSLSRLVDEWSEIQAGVKGAIGFLEERIFDKERLPTATVLPILSALWSVAPRALDGLGNARILLRKFIWTAFFTRRYENSAGSRALQDYRALLAALRDGEPDSIVPIFDRDTNPLPTTVELMRATWPKTRDTLARAILAVSLRQGALDLADGGPATREALRAREYHHLFPDALLREDGGLLPVEIYRALNCALITWNTNRTISAKEPISYLRERTLRSPLGEDDIRSRVQSHCVPYEELNVGGYSEIADIEVRKARVRSDYEAFLSVRAGKVEQAMVALCDGRHWPA